MFHARLTLQVQPASDVRVRWVRDRDVFIELQQPGLLARQPPRRHALISVDSIG